MPPAKIDTKVSCLECGKELKSLGAHLSYIHVMSVEDYRNKHGYDTPVGWTGPSGQMAKDRPPSEQPKDKEFTPEEEVYLAQRLATLSDQAEDDPALLPSIRDICMGEITITRYQKRLAHLTSNMDTQSFNRQAEAIKMINGLMQSTQASNLKLLESLNLTRAKKQQLKKSPESTPSRYVAQYERVKASLTRDQLERSNQEEKEALRRLNKNLEGLKEMVTVSATEGDPFDGLATS